MTAGTDKEEAEQFVLAAPKVQSYLEGRQIRKVIVVPERLVNIVCDYIRRTPTPLTAEVAVSLCKESDPIRPTMPKLKLAKKLFSPVLREH